MPASEAQMAANRANAARSTGPKTEEGKAASRANALKHGLTGAGVVLTEGAAVEIDRRFDDMVVELRAVGTLGRALVRHLATMSVRMESCADHHNAAQAVRVRKAVDEFEAPEGVDADEADHLRVEAARLALFDSSREASLARRYEGAACREFFRGLKELRALAKERARAEEEAYEAVRHQEELASFLENDTLITEFDALYPEPTRRGFRNTSSRVESAFEGEADVPMTIGRRR